MVGIFREDAWKYLNSKYPSLRNYCMIFGIRSAAGAKVFLEEHEFDNSNENIVRFIKLLNLIEYSETYLHNNMLEVMNANNDLVVTNHIGNEKRLSYVSHEVNK